ncbi:MAG: carboxypeptidase-like regulatory domain-containing protein [Odoribacter splanchnicus]
MKICLVLMCTFSLGLSAATYAQQERITLSLKEVTLKVLLDEVQRQTQLHFMINRETAASMGLVSVEVNNETVENVLGRIFQHSPLTWSFMDGIIVVKERDNLSEQQTEHTIVEGLVTDSRKQPLPGVTVTIKGTTMGVTTDVDGKFKLELAGKKDVVLVFFFRRYGNC